MRVKQLSIECFRGIKQLDWKIGGDFVCLVGAGDSTKSTILSAVELVLSPRWNITVDDSDFYDSETTRKICITATIGAVPEDLLTDDRYGLCIRGWSKNGELHDEPEDGDEKVFSVRLMIDASLEPKWTVFSDRNPEGVGMSSKDRELLGAFKVESYVDRHLSWSRGSILSRFTGGTDSTLSALTAASRAARAAITPDSLPKLRATAKQVAEVTKRVGVSPRSEYHLIWTADRSNSEVAALHSTMGMCRCVWQALGHDD